MAKKYKLTGCARFMIFAVIFVPAVYFGVTYFKGENPIDPIKNAIPESWSKPSEKKSDITEENILDARMKTLEQTNEELREKVKRLEGIIESRDAEIRNLKGK